MLDAVFNIDVIYYTLYIAGLSNFVDNLVLKMTQPYPKPQQNPNKTFSWGWVETPCFTQHHSVYDYLINK